MIFGGRDHRQTTQLDELRRLAVVSSPYDQYRKTYGQLKLVKFSVTLHYFQISQKHRTCDLAVGTCFQRGFYLNLKPDGKTWAQCQGPIDLSHTVGALLLRKKQRFSTMWNPVSAGILHPPIRRRAVPEHALTRRSPRARGCGGTLAACRLVHRVNPVHPTDSSIRIFL